MNCTRTLLFSHLQGSPARRATLTLTRVPHPNRRPTPQFPDRRRSMAHVSKAAANGSSRLHVVNQCRPDLTPFIATYKQIHAHPELSQQESATARLAAGQLRALGFEVHEGIGGHSSVGVLRNGPGKTVLLRADMDALPIREETGLPYASAHRMRDVVDGAEKPVMHACGHDLHTVALLAAAACLARAKEHWSGTLICLFQPDEEVGLGALSMVREGLYERIPRPDLLLAQHVFPLRAGTVALRAGPVFSAADEFKVRVFGKGGHASRPDACVDPILLAAHIIVRLQGVVSREVPPRSVAVVTCGSIIGGTASNIIPDYVDFTLSIRSYEPGVRKRVLDAVMRVIRSECETSGSPLEPTIERTDEAPPVINDDALTEQLTASFKDSFGTDVQLMEPTLASEDFPNLADGQIPYVYWTIGCIDQDIWDAANAKNEIDKLPGLHSQYFAPAIHPTLERGADSLAVAALTFLAPKQSTVKTLADSIPISINGHHSKDHP